MQDTRLPPSCMTSMEKLQRFIDEMDKQCALRHAQQSVSMSTSNHERISSTNEDNDSISIANESDLFDSYSADDITEIQQQNSPKIDMCTFREKIFNDMAFINERWKTITKKQVETGGNNMKLFRMPNFRYLISNKNKERTETLAVPYQHNRAFTDKIKPSLNSSVERQGPPVKEQRPSKVSLKIPSEENPHKSAGAIKSGELATKCVS